MFVNSLETEESWISILVLLSSHQLVQSDASSYRTDRLKEIPFPERHILSTVRYYSDVEMAQLFTAPKVMMHARLSDIYGPKARIYTTAAKT